MRFLQYGFSGAKRLFKEAKRQRKIENNNNFKRKKETVQTCRDGIHIKATMLEINSLRSLNMSHGRSLYFKLQPTEPVLGPATSTLMMWSSIFL